MLFCSSCSTGVQLARGARRDASAWCFEVLRAGCAAASVAVLVGCSERVGLASRLSSSVVRCKLVAREVALSGGFASVLTTLAIALPRGSNEAYGQSGSRTGPLTPGLHYIDKLNAIDATRTQDAIDGKTI